MNKLVQNNAVVNLKLPFNITTADWELQIDQWYFNFQD